MRFVVLVPKAELGAPTCVGYLWAFSGHKVSSSDALQWLLGIHLGNQRIGFLRVCRNFHENNLVIGSSTLVCQALSCWSYLGQKLSYSVLYGPTYAVLSPWTFPLLLFTAKKWLLHIKILDFVQNATLSQTFLVISRPKTILQCALWAYTWCLSP